MKTCTYAWSNFLGIIFDIQVRDITNELDQRILISYII